MLRNFLKTALTSVQRLSRINADARLFSGLYSGDHSLPTDVREELFKKSSRLAIFSKHLQFQEDNRCVGAATGMLAASNQFAALKDGQTVGYVDLDDPVGSLERKLGPDRPSGSQSRTEKFAEMLKQKVQENGPLVIHFAGIGGVPEQVSITKHENSRTTIYSPTEGAAQKPYGVHAIVLADVIASHNGEYGVFVDPNDRSTHPLVESFKEKYPGIQVGQLTSKAIMEHGLDEAMVYVAPLKEMLELSLLEYFAEKLRQQELTGKSVQTIGEQINDHSDAVQFGIAYSLYVAADSLRRPDVGLQGVIKSADIQKKLVTSEKMRKIIKDKKEALANEFPDFKELWAKMHGDKPNSRGKGLRK